MDLATDISRIADQEHQLRFARFDAQVAWQLGTSVREIAARRALALAIEIRLAGETIFFVAMPGTTPANADWARRKRNTVELLHRSSYGVGRALEQEGKTLEQTMGLPARDYATHGGSFPLIVDGAGCIGAITVSGAPQRVDHEVVVEALAGLCGVALAKVALD
jgi:uncharacterized protein (UPF0303 family)